jgi:hypothetical protein
MPTFDFAPAISELVLNAYGRIGLRRTALGAEHMVDARIECNLLQAEWSNQQVNLWTVDLVSMPLSQGVATYVLPTETITVLDAYVSTENSDGSSNDRIIMPVSRTEYASYPDKSTQGIVTTFWFDRLGSPTISLYLTPDGGGPYTLRYYRARQVGDATLTGTNQPDVPYRWLDAWVAGLACRLARLHAPERLQEAQGEAIRTWGLAATQDIENAPLRVIPGLSSYYR